MHRRCVWLREISPAHDTALRVATLLSVGKLVARSLAATAAARNRYALRPYARRPGGRTSCGRSLHRKQAGKQGSHHEDTKNTKKGFMRFARCLSGHKREAQKIRASSC